MIKRQRGGCGTIVFAIIWIVFSLLVTGVTGFLYVNEASENRALDEHGVVISAQITAKDEEYDEGTTYWVWYSFQVKAANGEITTYSGKEAVSSDTYYRLENGSNVDIIYASTDPTISDMVGERDKAPWFLPVFAGGFVIFGLVMLVWAVRKEKASRSDPNQLTSSDPSLSALRPAYAESRASIDLDNLRCEKCGLLLGPEMMNCMHRASEACVYTLSDGKIPGGVYVGAILIAFGAFFAGMPASFSIFGNLSDGFEFFDLVGILFTLPFIVVGLAVLTAGIFVIFGRHTTLHNEQTGQRWQMSTFLGRVIYEIRASGLQDVKLSAPHISSTYPVSCAALVNGDNTTGIIYNTLLSLMAHNVITMRQQYTATWLFFKRKPITKWRFAFNPSNQGNMLDGKLERKLADAAREPNQDVANLPQQYRFILGMPSAKHGSSISEMLRNAANNTEHNNPHRWFIVELIGPDAQDHGLGTMTKVRLRKEYHNNPGMESSVAAINQHMAQTRTDFQRRYPEAAEDLWQAIESGLNALEPSND